MDGFDLTTHVRDRKTGAVLREQPYRMHVNGGTRVFERGGRFCLEDGSEAVGFVPPPKTKTRISPPPVEVAAPSSDFEKRFDLLSKQVGELMEEVTSSNERVRELELENAELSKALDEVTKAPQQAKAPQKKE